MADLHRVLLVDDDAVFRERMARALRERGLDVVTAGGAEEAERVATTGGVDGALVDLVMPGGSGLAVVRRLHALHPRARLVVLTGYGSIATALEAVRFGAADYLSKPIDADQAWEALHGRRETDRRGPAVPSLDRVEWEHIQRVLVETGGNISETARLLGIDRRSLQRKLAKLAPKR